MNRRWFLRTLPRGRHLRVGADKTEKGSLKEVNDDKHTPGQVLELQDARPGEETSKITIFGVEEAPQGKRIVHIHVDGIKLNNSMGGDAPEQVEHMPFAKEFIDQSVTDVMGKGQAPDLKMGAESGGQCGTEARPASIRSQHPRRSTSCSPGSARELAVRQILEAQPI